MQNLNKIKVYYEYQNKSKSGSLGTYQFSYSVDKEKGAFSIPLDNKALAEKVIEALRGIIQETGSSGSLNFTIHVPNRQQPLVITDIKEAQEFCNTFFQTYYPEALTVQNRMTA